MSSGKTAFILTARGGSKGLPGKNTMTLGEHPLLAYRILSALKVKSPKRIFLSTDSPEIAKIASAYPVECPFLRNPEYATDTARCEDAVFEMLEYALKSEDFDYVCMLQPTSPFTRAADLEAGLEKLARDPSATAIVSTRQTHPSTYYVQKDTPFLNEIGHRIATHGLLRRQDEQVEVTPSGNFYFSKTRNFMQDRSFYRSTTLNHLIEDPYGLEIDRPLDFKWAQFLLNEKLISLEDIV